MVSRVTSIRESWVISSGPASPSPDSIELERNRQLEEIRSFRERLLADAVLSGRRGRGLFSPPAPLR
jgi:hypothetical protein